MSKRDSEHFFSKELDERILESIATFFISVLDAGTAFFRKSRVSLETGKPVEEVTDEDADNVVPFR